MKDLQTLIADLKDKEGEAFSLSETSFESEIATATHTPTSWIIRVVTMLGAWIAAACFFGLISLMGIFDSPTAILVLGIVLIAAAILAFRSITQNIFIIPFALTASITGQICLAGGLEMMLRKDDFSYNFKIIFLIELLIQAILFVATTNNIQKFIATLAFNGFLVSLLFTYQWYDSIHIVLGINALILTSMILWEEKIMAHFKNVLSSYQPLTAAITLSFLFLIFTKLIEQNTAWQDIKIHHWWISTGFMLLCLLLTLYKVAQDFGWSYLKTLPIILIFVPLIGSPGILAGILILLLGFYHKSVWYIGMGILALAVFISVFYYNLHTTLWAKSLILMGSGLLFLGVFFLIRIYDKSLTEKAN